MSERSYAYLLEGGRFRDVDKAEVDAKLASLLSDLPAWRKLARKAKRAAKQERGMVQALAELDEVMPFVETREKQAEAYLDSISTERERDMARIFRAHEKLVEVLSDMEMTHDDLLYWITFEED